MPDSDFLNNGKRIIDQPDGTLSPDDYFIVDDITVGTKKVKNSVVTENIGNTLGVDRIKKTADGAMQKSTYDTDGDGIVDNAAKLGNQAPSYYAKKTDLDNTDKNLQGKMDKSVYDVNGDGIVDQASNASTVNNHTVNSDVPENAKFTDTLYDDTQVKADIKTNSDNIEQLGKNIDAETEALQKKIINIEDYLGYVSSDVPGVEIDYQNKTYTRLGGAAGLSAGADFNKFQAFGGRRRCNLSDQGVVTAYRGDSAYIEDGSNGQVMVEQPRFYYRRVPLKLEKQTGNGIGYHIRKERIYISDTPRPGFKVHRAFKDKTTGRTVPFIYRGAFEASIYDFSASTYLQFDEQVMAVGEDKLSSVAGVKPASGLTQQFTRPNVETLANNRGEGFHSDYIESVSATQMLMLVELACNFQEISNGGIGQGVVSITDNSSYNCSSQTGSTSSLGNNSGRAASTVNYKGTASTTETADGKTSITYRGEENPYGNIWKFIYGVNIWGNGSMNGGMPYVCNDFNFAEFKRTDNYIPVGFTITNANGYISAMGYGDEEYDWLFIASECTGNSALPIGDYHYITVNLNGYRIALLGGRWDDGAGAGGFYWHLAYGVGYRIRIIGGRLVYVPKAKEAA